MASAQLSVVPDVSAEGRYESNALALPSREQAIIETGSDKRDDVVSRYTGGATGDYRFDMQQLHARVEGRRVDYDHFSQYDHDEYRVDTAFKWWLSRVVDGQLYFVQERAMTDPANVQTAQLTMQRERRTGGTINVMPAADWRIENRVESYDLSLSPPASPGLNTSETSIATAIKYVGMDKLAVGILVEALRGEYVEGAAVSQYDQTKVQLTASESISGLSDIGASLGYTTRRGKTPGSEDDSGVTGALSYNRRLSAKTRVNLEVFRSVDSYVAGASAVIDEGVRAGIVWQPSFKTGVDLHYEWTASDYQGQGGSGSSVSNRRDHYQDVVLELGYQPTDWLSIHPFFRYVDRQSNVQIDGYNDAVSGVRLSASFGGPPGRFSVVDRANDGQRRLH